MRKSLWWILTALIPAFTLAAVTLTPANLETALAAQRQLVAEHPGDAKVFNDLGNLLVLAGRLSEAEEVYRHSLEIDSSRVTARFNLGLLLQQLGRNRDALAEYQKVIKQDPSHAWAYYQIGTIYEAAQQEGRAIKTYAKAFSLDPQLAFPEVNPHVIDNRLLTEALLQANQRPSGGVLAPKAYEDPGRIAALLVPRVPAPEDGEEADMADAAEAEEEPEEPLPAKAAEGAVRTLTEGDLDLDASSNQAAPLTNRSVTRYGTTYRPPRTVRPPTTSRQPIVRPQSPPPVQRLRPGGVGVPVVPREQPSEESGRTQPRTRENSQGRVQVPGRTPTGFRPGPSSTGRLEMRLLPLPSGEPTQAAG